MIKRLEPVFYFLVLGILVGCSTVNKSEEFRIYSYSTEQDRSVLLKKSELIKKHEMNFASKILKRMHEFLKKADGGIGISAPQVGICKRLIVIDLTSVPGLEKSKPMLMINPVITKREGISYSAEGCISVDGYGVFERSSEVEVEFFGVDGIMHYAKLIGIEAFCCQHEVDHLNGILISSDRSISGLKDPLLLAKEIKDKNMDIKIKNDLRLDELKSKYAS